MMGYQFRRQRPLGNYIVDFVSLPLFLFLIIEVDGLTHDEDTAVVKDIKRDIELENLGYTTLRFSSSQVLDEIASVIY